jgi:hypothetical protein
VNHSNNSNNISQVQTSSSINQLKTLAPVASQFLIPSTSIEHEQMIDRMAGGGLLRTEAEQNILTRKAAFNKTCKVFKKAEPKPAKSQTRKPTRTNT